MTRKKPTKLRPHRSLVVAMVAVLVVAVGIVWWAGPQLSVQRSVAVGQASVTIVAVGDLSCEANNPDYNGGQGTGKACHAKATSDLTLSLNPAAVLTLGDEQYRSGTLGEFQDSYDKTWGRLKAITKPVPGNHEYENFGAAGYYDYFGAVAGFRELGYYSYDVGDWHVIALNANCASVGGCEKASLQERWLKHDLEEHRNVCTLAYWHQPRFSSGLNGSDAAYQPFWQDLTDAKADVVLTGHDHDYERFAPQRADGTADPNGIREFVVGTGGESLTGLYSPAHNSVVRDNLDYGVLKMSLKPAGYDWQFVTDTGAVKDSGTAACVNQPAGSVAPVPQATPQPTPASRPL